MSLNLGNNDTPLLQDVKPTVGYVPRPEPPPARPSVGKNFFTVELLVGDEQEQMRPFSQFHHKEAPLSIDHYVSTSGLTFAIRVQLERGGTEGNLYGARVYIDQGSAARDKVYAKEVGVQR